MEKKIRLLVVVFLFIVTFITIVTTFSQLNASTSKGHWLYDKEGTKIGCKSPGTDCFWGEPEPIE